ncbi:MAG: hypothetical protein MUO76_22240 [Anaerolineaceae bacterium]|nr:hypothetical protein [Anaerolineaceae bacterium]
MMRKPPYTLLGLTILILLACNLSDYTQKPTVTQTIEIPTPTQEIVQETAQSVLQRAGYPETPEAVVYAFLTSYEIDQNEMLFYLSSSLLSNLPAGGVFTLLQFDGVLEGFVFQSGSSSEDPKIAVVEVKIRVDGEDSLRIFYLIRENQYWLITSIEIPGE